MPLDRTEDIIDDIRQGKMVVIMDDEDRENEGDLLMAASWSRPEDINFMARYGRGLICLTLTEQRCRQLNLPLMVNDKNPGESTNFTVSIEAAEGVTTGISAADRAVTVRAAVDANAGPDDLVQPGHIFPLMAQPGGVLTRAGHTEAGCDLARLAGLEPAAVIVEILNEDGTMARRPDLETFAAEHGLRMGTIADLIEYRLRNEQTVERVADTRMPTVHGDFRMVAFRDLSDQRLHWALVKGEPEPETPTLVRVHVHDGLCDAVLSRRGECGWPLDDALARLAEAESGVAVILRPPENEQAMLNRLRDWELRDQGVELPGEGASDDLRTYGIGAQILTELGVRRMRVLSAPKRLHALSGYGLEVVEYVDGNDNN
ncbi:MAG: bifunctional 3,4-dihydroxy-2-butanone-4-phosphate synthase/GTP cyclohydrolase II [Pseudomonadota bacterium]